MLIPTKLSFYCWHLIKRGENRAEWRVAFSEGGKQKKAERRGQDDALNFESRDRQKNPRRRFTFSGLILENKKKRQVETGTNFHGLFLVGQTAPVKVFFSITNGKQKKQQPMKKKEEVEEIVVSGLV